ncbi:hypothetical protein HU200_023518 [Digitaria exilis]|uniref:Uncharacterized protein n=1 Tax=Digitaria exilis TaxID=1010633 RepID=A0A835CC02_9POAL|nr:hypothetical protein HU200_023518 [Digitaria exilis]CAB3496010.1 unnamed protein product [Digitaria exilis]
MADMVVSALAQEGVSRASSYISAKLEDKASSAHNLARLEMALSQLEFALERIARVPITYLSLLRRVRMLKNAYAEGTALLNKYRGRQGEAGQAATPFRLLEWIGRARSISSSLLGLNKDHLSSGAVQMFEWYADCAEKLVADVETGCPLRRDTFRYPFVRHLLEDKTLWYERIRGSQRMRFHMMPLRLGDRGVEAELFYCHQDLERTQKNFCVWLMLRLSESTDVIGIAIKCLQLLTSQFKLAIESAVGELTLLPGLQDVSDSYAPPLDCIQDTYASRDTKYWRPDPTCCNADGTSNNTVSQNGVPEQVIAIGFSCWISAPEYTPRDARAPPPLYVEAFFAPHLSCAPNPEIMWKYGGKEEESTSGSMQQMEEVIRSNALDYLVHEQEPTDYAMFWFSEHGAAFITLRKTSNEKAWPKLRARGRSGGKRKR